MADSDRVPEVRVERPVAIYPLSEAERLRIVEQQANDHQHMLENHDRILGELNGHLKSLDGHVERFDRRLSNLGSRVNERVDRLTRRIERVVLVIGGAIVAGTPGGMDVIKSLITIFGGGA